MTAPTDPADQEIWRRQTWSRVGSAWVRAIEVAPVAAWATAVLLPGLGLPRYTRPTVEALARGGVHCVVLDLLAWRRPRLRVPPRIGPMAEAAARWVREADVTGPLVLVGHSTGSQVALGASLRLQHDRADHALVLAGLTFRPEHRTWPGLLRGAATAYRKDTPAELVVARDIARLRTDLVHLVESARRDRPEVRVRHLQVPLVLTAGQSDSFAPQVWMSAVAEAAGPTARVEVLPGSHNNLFTHPEEVAGVVSRAALRTAALPPEGV
jgi:pimeloyl-ACP methyl ester carboxylesterase